MEKHYDDTEQIRYSDIDSKLSFGISAGANGGQEWDYPNLLSREYRKYMHVRAVNTYEYYQKVHGEKKKLNDISYHNFVRCTQKSIQTQIHQNYMAMYEDDYYYCLEDDSVYISGTRDS